ncbi:MAG TPA: tetratricopeptide repeat protein [Pirellulales bacterium]|jgi:regulator of sirC expression with transglutaminase-like and TPR domain|nr:tetratricopeptide repeat protein [Pirellulales bacterium]
MAAPFQHDVQFQRLRAGQSEIDLVELLLEFAGDAYPNLDPAPSRIEIERLQDRARSVLDRLGASATLSERLAAIGRLLYVDVGFRGNQEDYYDPRNSYLNDVLERRMGIPISLAIVFMTVAGGAGLKVFGVSTPGHFMLGARSADGALYLDPFEHGEVLSAEDCRRHIERRLGRPDTIVDEDLRPARHLEIAARVLRNLKAAYAMREQWEQVLPVQSRLALLLPELSDEQRDLGLVYLRTGRPCEALELFEAYLKVCQADDAQALHPYLRSARRLLAERN